MYVTTQFSIFMVNRPGLLARVLRKFAEAKLNMVAMTMMDSVEHGVLRVIFEDPDKARTLLAEENMQYNENEVLCVQLDNKAGALSVVAEKLAENHLNISYAYCTAGGKGGKTTGVMKVADVQKAMKLLEAVTKKQSKAKRVTRRSKSASA